MNNKQETRGRPRKEVAMTMPPHYKELFSENSAVISASCLIYVFQMFLETKNQRRIGHKDGGFTIYEKISTEYCFETFERDLQQWRLQGLLDEPALRGIIEQLPALGPRMILREIAKFIFQIYKGRKRGESRWMIHNRLTEKPERDEDYPHMRFLPNAIRQLKLDRSLNCQKNQKSIFDVVKDRRENLWSSFVKIMVETVINSLEESVMNKLFKAFFSDAEKPQDTYIGQLNLDQIVDRMDPDIKREYERENITPVKNTQPIVLITNPPLKEQDFEENSSQQKLRHSLQKRRQRPNANQPPKHKRALDEDGGERFIFDSGEGGEERNNQESKND